MLPQQILKKYWGYDAFRPMQEEIINSVLEGNDTLALLPTGGGKSICFQVPAMALEGVCIVVTPLIALMKDQVFQLNKRGISAKAIYSGMSKREIDIILDNCVYGKNIKFLYLSPERLKTDLFKERVAKMNVGLLAIDEAHCISQWGYNFRPAYLEIAAIREKITNVPCIALTATATLQVREDIQDKLDFKDNKKVFTKSFSRANLSYSAFLEENKNQKMLQILNNVRGTGIIYVRNRKRCKEIALWLRQQKISADFYHAGLTHAQRNHVQESWISGKIRVIAATNAFGMGIDKPDVRTVIHTDLPDSLEAYYQEAGRAGRDEKKAYAIALFDNNDLINLEKRTEQAHPEPKIIKKVYQALANYFKIAVGSFPIESFDFDMEEFYRRFSIPYIESYNSIKILEEQGFLQLSESFYTPSKIWIKVDNATLYNFQIANPKSDTVIKGILRAYGGAFQQFISISEQNLSRFLKMPKMEVVAQLNYLAQQNIIDYQPQKDVPQLSFLTPRHNANDLPLDLEFLKVRKKEAMQKAFSVINYVSNDMRCRTQILLHYFGEKTDEVCGVCDNCIKNKKAANGTAKNESEDIKTQILEKIASHSIPVHKLQQHFKNLDATILGKIIQEMVATGIIQYDKSGNLISK
ncbi:ATP-dependent DNA helicase RecQ [Bernardetia sp.]|uniref:RecQ family ATP-dependent DNA helicase n=1 Tax=Bernardetia sp. TaxID=1937974 RepID=UPI0025C317F2|nr:ATP-dependent DNA helicase RecQ [Bernardetia sp.]